MPRIARPRALEAVLSLAFSFGAGAAPLDAPWIELPPDGGIVHSATPLISGTTAAGARVTIQIDGGAAGTATADATGAWRHIPAVLLSPGSHRVTASVQDAGGAISTSGPVDFTVAEGPPDAPVVSVPGDGAHVGFRPVFAGSAEPGTTARILVDGKLLTPEPVEVTLQGWRFKPAEDLERGAHSLSADVVEPGGIPSPLSRASRFTVVGSNLYTFGCSAPPRGALAPWTWLLIVLGCRRPSCLNRPARPGHPRARNP